MPVYTATDAISNGVLSILNDTDSDIIVYIGSQAADVDLIKGADSRLGGPNFVQVQTESAYLSNKVEFGTNEPVRGDIVSVSDVSGGGVTLSSGNIRFDINPQVSDLSGGTVQIQFDFTLADGRTFGVVENFLYYNLVTELTGSLSATVEEFYAGAGDDTVRGNGVANILDGGVGDDSLFGRSGNDTIIGGIGSDFLDGGDGRDILQYTDSEFAVEINLGTSTVFGGDATGDVIANFEGVDGSLGDDILVGLSNASSYLFGDAGQDSLEGGGAGDTLIGGDGADLLMGGGGGDLIIGDGMVL